MSAVHVEESGAVPFDSHKVLGLNCSSSRSHFPFDFQLSKLSHGTWHLGGGKWDSNEDSHLQNIPYQKPELEDEDEDKDVAKIGGQRADTAGSERVAEGIVADEVTEKEAAVSNSLENSTASGADLKKVRLTKLCCYVSNTG